MNHTAIDLGSVESYVCTRQPDSSIIDQRRVKTARLKRFLSALPAGRVIIETSAESFHVADLAIEAGHEIRVVPSTLVRALGVGSRRLKTDERDARILSEVSCRIDLPSVHIPSKPSRQLKSSVGGRSRLVAARTMLINQVRGWGRTEGLSLGGRNSSVFAERIREKLEGPDGVPVHIDRTLEVIGCLSEQIALADRELRELVKGDELFERLMSVPGIGPVTAVRFVATIDDVTRFESAAVLRSYLGLVPGENSSGKRVRRTGITKAGAPAMRHTLVQAAWAARRSRKHRNDPMIGWADRIEKRRGKRIATVALARKMAGILYAIWRDGKSYNAGLGADKNVD
ncbi:IS110 family transposase [bacterium AH-315-N03]|nr:IS110 family transposase [bacterium AH-315-N03]